VDNNIQSVSSPSPLTHKQIAHIIKPILLTDAMNDFIYLREIVNAGFRNPRAKHKKNEPPPLVNLSRCRIGNNFVDYFTFAERLNTRGKYDINFYDFVSRIDEFSQKKFIKNMLDYYGTVKNINKQKHTLVVYKEVYNICISAINIIRPIVICDLFLHWGQRPSHILDFNMGWGGALAAAYAVGIDNYTGIDLNGNLREGYEKMIHQMENENAHTNTTTVKLYWSNALLIDYEKLPPFDFVFTSPPYFFIEKYSNEIAYKNKSSMIDEYYIPIFTKTWNALQGGGKYCLSINKEIYNTICVPLLGIADEMIALGRSKRGDPIEKRTKEYEEWIYVWNKPL
jgi:16S rRNA G966 N2-methylase RsmD